jgi:hypothetical protein
METGRKTKIVGCDVSIPIDLRGVCEHCGLHFPPRFSDACEPLRFCERLCERRRGMAVGLIPPRRRTCQGSKFTASDLQFLRELRISQH